jgi:2-dehydropantoate 2-reductase
VKIAVVGCGALGSFYGAKLWKSGQAVHFLLRSDYEVVRQQGVWISSVNGDFQAQPACARTPEAIGVCDGLLIGLKTTANAQFRQLLPPLVSKSTAVITLQNGLGNEAALAQLFPSEQILGGLCFVCLNRLRPGFIQHSAHGHIILGEYRRPASDRTRRLAEMFRAAGVACVVTNDLDSARWQKLIWNVPFNGLGVAGVAGYEAVVSGRVPAGLTRGPCLATDFLLSHPLWYRLVYELMNEVIATAHALGHPLAVKLAEDNLERTRCMGAYRASTLVDFERGRPLELDSLFLEPLRCARHASIAVPRLTALCEVLKAIDPGRHAWTGGSS